MKKRNLKSLKLNKKSISNFSTSTIKGGTIESIINPLLCAGSEGVCENTYDGVVCDLQTPAPKQ